MQSSHVLLERAEELAAIDAVIADTLAGLGRFAVIEGSAGIGKSSLLAEARLRAGAAGMSVLTARGSEIERSFSYGVVRQLFERLVAQSDQTERSRLLAGAAAHASRLFSAEQLPGQLRASEDDAFALVHGLYWLALNLAEERPLLISIDDLQWSDEASLRWVAYLVRRLEETRGGRGLCGPADRGRGSGAGRATDRSGDDDCQAECAERGRGHRPCSRRAVGGRR